MSSAHKHPIHEIERLRGIAILAVIGIHIFGIYPAIVEPGLLKDCARFMVVILRFAVPAFLIISGTVLARGHRTQLVRDFYKKRVHTLLLPYLFFSFFYMLVRFIAHGPLTLNQILSHLLYATAAEHLWFFRLVFELYLLFPLLLFLAIRYRTATVLAALVIQIGADSFFTFLPHAPSVERLLIFSRYIFYFVFGISMGLRFGHALRSFFPAARTIIFMGLAILIVAVSNFMYPMASTITEPGLYLCSTLFLYAVVSRLGEKNTRANLLEGLGRHSYGIFLIHIFFLSILIRTLRPLGLDLNSPLYYPVLFFLTAGTSLAACRLITKTSAAPYLLGVRLAAKASPKNVLR